MKVDGKSFEIYKNQRPKVLLLGNGLNRAFNSESWSDFLRSIKNDERYPLDPEKYILPMGLKAAMLSDGQLMQSLKKYNYKLNNTYCCDKQELLDILYQIVSLPFDYILTTNYSYEIELALSHKRQLNNKEIAKFMNFTEGKGAEKRYFLHTYNSVKAKNHEYQIWHIHGEYRKPESMVIGQYYYGNLLYCYNKVLKDNIPEYVHNIKKSQEQRINSWVDAFILGDVYMVGLGMDFAETDLWWLLEKKSVQTAGIPGKTIFYNPKNLDDTLSQNTEDYVNENKCKKNLIGTYGVEIRDLQTTIYNNSNYIDFYKKIISEMNSIW